MTTKTQTLGISRYLPGFLVYRGYRHLLVGQGDPVIKQDVRLKTKGRFTRYDFAYNLPQSTYIQLFTTTVVGF